MVAFQRYIRNDGRRDLAWLGMMAAILAFLLRSAAVFGEYRKEFNTLRANQTALEREGAERSSTIAGMREDVREMKTDIRWIRETLRKEARR